MRLILRLALACLLVLALPLQGLAASVQPAGVETALAGQPPRAAPVAALPAGTALLDAGDAFRECPDHPAGSTDAHHRAPLASTVSACEDCGACTHGVLGALALVPAPLAVPPAPHSPTRWPAPLLTPEPPWPKGLERPPRRGRI
ncbi:hypothetical protein QRD43_19320 [Pelomonas sp. APW6]|uniref:DUF2946 domain-containing protein n=1 Tax=Roseateles subflavus TaxID=3053353 RepID=A0ABT7LMF5_9BURK|nr:hypothetical protein [Pelomonas sp. APW6]MDL5034058.1 hypothetical protein [Pelomonas sp. APW6]